MEFKIASRYENINGNPVRSNASDAAMFVRGSPFMPIPMNGFVFEPQEWFTPNTYDRNFRNVPNKAGVYLIVLPKFLFDHLHKIEFEVLYIGSSKDLKVRYQRHEVLRLLTKQYGYVQFYFREVENHLDVEKKLIKLVQPKYNTQWL